ncbi:hypothetical protein ZWY2020_018803 [Hordeum vulgare]|nr:hypothetical protein ZWY2020_018803 [Hordeum vulgare]
MRWYDDGIKHHLCPRPQWTTTDVEALYDDGSKNEAYHDNIRDLEGGFRENAPLTNIRSSEVNKSIFEGSHALSSIPGTRVSEKKLRETVKKFVNKCRKLVGLLGCARSAHAYALASPLRSLSSLSHATSSSRVVEEEDNEEEGEDEEDDEERAEEEEQCDEEKEYDDDEGPPPTHTT